MSKYRLTVRAIIVKNDHILLNEFNHGEYYNLPGGGLEIGESLRECVAREVLEESGYYVTTHEMLYVYEYNPKRDGYSYGQRGALSHVFRCEIDESKPPIERSVIDSDKVNKSVSTGCKWLPVSELSNIHLNPKINETLINDIRSMSTETKFLENIH